MSDNEDPRAERQRLVDLQQKMASDPAPETRAQLLQTREALIQLDEARHGDYASSATRTLELGHHGRIVMVRVSTNYLFRPNQFLMRLEDFAPRAGYKPDRNAKGDQWIEECVAG